MYGYVYIVEDLDNGKLYVGRHIGSFDKKYWGSGKLIKKAIKEKGFDNFRRILFCYCDNNEELNNLEYQLINQLNTITPNGYNICNGNLQNYENLNSGKKRTQKQKEFIRQRTIECMKTMKNKEKLAYWKGKKNTKHSKTMKEMYKNHQIKNHNMQTYIKCSCGKEVMSIHMSRHLKANHKLWFKHQV